MRVRERGREPDDAHRVRLETAACPHRFSRTKVVSTGQFKTRTRARPPRGSSRNTLDLVTKPETPVSPTLKLERDSGVSPASAARWSAPEGQRRDSRLASHSEGGPFPDIYIYIYIDLGTIDTFPTKGFDDASP